MAVPVIDTHLELARLAMGELNRTMEKPFPPDMLNDAEYYIGEGYDVLTDHSTYDPNTDAVKSARRAVVEFAKARLMGLPYTRSQFPDFATLWQRAAAREAYEAKVAD